MNSGRIPSHTQKESQERRASVVAAKGTQMGFAVPIGAWLRDELAGMLPGMPFAQDSFTRSHRNSDYVRQLVDEHHTHRADHSQRLYALLMLELWWRAAREETLWL